MVKSIEESARERRNYVEQARAAFGNQEQGNVSETVRTEPAQGTSTFGIRLVIAILLFACFVYCDQEKITYQGISAQEIVKQVEWNPLPTEKLEELLGDISISGGAEEKLQSEPTK